MGSNSIDNVDAFKVVNSQPTCSVIGFSHSFFGVVVVQTPTRRQVDTKDLSGINYGLLPLGKGTGYYCGINLSVHHYLILGLHTEDVYFFR